MGDPKADLFREMFFEEAGELLAAPREGPGRPGMRRAMTGAARPGVPGGHSLKGAAAMVGFAAISERALAIERALGQVRIGDRGGRPELAGSLEADREDLAALIASGGGEIPRIDYVRLESGVEPCARYRPDVVDRRSEERPRSWRVRTTGSARCSSRRCASCSSAWKKG